MPYVICNFSSTFLVLRGIIEKAGNGLKIAEAMVNLQSKHSWIVPRVSQWTCSLAEMGSNMRSEGCDKMIRKYKNYDVLSEGWKRLKKWGNWQWWQYYRRDNKGRLIGETRTSKLLQVSSISLVLPLRSIPSMLRNQMLWICFQAAMDPERKKQWNWNCV